MSDILHDAEAMLPILADPGKEIPWQVIELMPRLVAEIKRLRDVIDLLDRRDGCKDKQLATKDIAIARLRKIAIDLKAMFLRIALPCPIEKCEIEKPCEWQSCPQKDYWRYQAAQELQLEAAKEAGYVERLEKEFLAFVTHHEMMGGKREVTARDAAQAALAKIREGKA